MRENAGGAGWRLTPLEIDAIDRVFPAPDYDVPLGTLWKKNLTGSKNIRRVRIKTENINERSKSIGRYSLRDESRRVEPL